MQGKLVVHVDTHELTEHIDDLSTIFTKLTAGLIITGMLIGAAMVTTQIAQLWPIFVVLLVVATWLIWHMLHPPRRP